MRVAVIKQLKTTLHNKQIVIAHATTSLRVSSTIVQRAHHCVLVLAIAVSGACGDEAFATFFPRS